MIQGLESDPGLTYVLDLGEVLVTDQLYIACVNIIEHYRRKNGFKVTICHLAFPAKDEDEIVNSITAKISKDTKLVFFDHMSSALAVKHPAQKILNILKIY